MGGDADQKKPHAQQYANRRRKRGWAVKAESEGSVEEPGRELGSVQQEARTCPVCGTKFFATADKEFCPVCILHRAFGPESKATGVSGSAASTEEADRGS